MNRAFQVLVCIGMLGIISPRSIEGQEADPKPRRNVIIFVADGLRHGSVNAQDTPALWSIRTEGVHLENSHSLFPTFTTANASAIATGHGIGDTGDFSNTIWAGFAIYDTGNFGLAPGTPTPYIENDQILADLDDHFHGNYLNEETLLGLARAQGYNTAAIGKVGPVAIQDAAALAPVKEKFPSPPATIVVDDSSGTPVGVPLAPRLLAQLQKEKLSLEAPARTNGYGATSPYNNGYSGDIGKAGTVWPNTIQQQWFADVATRAVLPLFADDAGKPFAILFWSRDPDGTQHNQGDGLNQLAPGINGETSRQAVRNADNNLRQLLDWLHTHPEIEANTDVFVTADHGFATISRKEIDRLGHTTTSESAKHYYFDATGKEETDKGTLPLGFLAIDLALSLKMNLFDPDRRAGEGSRRPFKQLRLGLDSWEHPAFGNGLIGEDVLKADGSDAKLIVAANGGSDLIYIPNGKKETVENIVSLLLGCDYVGGIFVDDKYGEIPGALPLSAIGLSGSSVTPRPAVAVALKVFYLNPSDMRTAIQISDTVLQEGQGMHGGFGRDSTYNNMAVLGPDFKKRFVDRAPVSNADIVPTLARVMGISLTPKGSLTGRVIEEALVGGTDAPAVERKRTPIAASGKLQTLLLYQEYGGERYLDAACMVVPDARAEEATCPH
jgi:arylsulfatase A-like enzyme